MRTDISHGIRHITLLTCLVIVPLLLPASTFAEPIITCPPATLDVIVAERHSVAIDLPISDADSVLIPNAVWTKDQLVFTATRQGLWQFVVVAQNADGKASCLVEVRVTYDQTPPPPVAGNPPEPDSLVQNLHNSSFPFDSD